MDDYIVVDDDNSACSVQEEWEVHVKDIFEYSIKVINPSSMSEYKNIHVCKWKQCKTLVDLWFS